MNLHQAALNYLLTISPLQEWSSLLSLLRDVADTRPPHWRLPVLTCQATGGERNVAVPAVAAVGCLHTAIILVDGLLDADPAGRHHRLGVGPTANLASALQVLGLRAILCSGIAEPVQRSVVETFTDMLYTTALGQAWDVQSLSDEEGYWRLVRMKSAPFFQAAFQCGALFGGASSQVAGRIGQIGSLYGEMIQIHDDLNDALAVPAAPDWSQGHASLPILFAQLVAHPERDRFRQIRKTVSDPGALAEAQQILVRCGAISYGIDQLLQRGQEARQQLASIPLVRREKLDHLLAEVIAPVQALLAATERDDLPEPGDRLSARRSTSAAGPLS